MNKHPLFLKNISTHNLAIVSLIGVSAGYTLLSISARLLNEGFEEMTQVYMRIAFGAIFAILLFRKKLRWNHILHMPSKDKAILLSMGTLGYAIAVYFITLGSINAKLVDVAVIFASVPFFSYLYAFLFLRKPIDMKLICLLALSVLGIMFVATKSFVPQIESFGKGEYFTLLATATMAWFYVGRKVLSNHLNNSEITVVVMLIAAITAFLFAQIRHETFLLSAFTNPNVILGLFIGAGMNIFANYAEAFAFNYLDAVVGSQIFLLENVFSLIAGFFFYNEIVTSPEIVGGLIIIGSVYFANKQHVSLK